MTARAFSRIALAAHLVPAVLCWWLLGAHFFRWGLFAPTAICALAPLAFALRGRWVRVVSQWAMVGGAAVWVYTAMLLAEQRQMIGAAWLRMAIILGGVAAFNLLAAALLARKPMREWFAVSIFDRDE